MVDYIEITAADEMPNCGKCDRVCEDFNCEKFCGRNMVGGATAERKGGKMMHLIDASDPKNKLYVSQEVFDCMQRIPTIDPESLRPQGEWIDNHCTACGETPLGEELWEHIDGEPPRFERCMDYCPCCGAKMKGGTP